MAYTARQLITKSYYLSQIVARGLQTVSGEQIADGLDLLNALLAVKGSDVRLIPYFRRDSFPTIAGTEEYYRPNLLQIEAITFNLGDVRFPMTEMSRRDFFNTPRIDNIQSLPFSWRQERELGGTRIYLYFEPNAVYTVKLSGKFGLTSVALDDDLELTYDGFYIEYLRYALAEYICQDYGNTFPEGSQLKMREIVKKLIDVSPPDLSLRKVSYFTGKGGVLDWQQVNVGQGWTV